MRLQKNWPPSTVSFVSMDNICVLIVLTSDDFHATIERLVDVGSLDGESHFKVFRFDSRHLVVQKISLDFWTSTVNSKHVFQFRLCSAGVSRRHPFFRCIAGCGNWRFNSQEPAMPLTDGATGAEICWKMWFWGLCMVYALCFIGFLYDTYDHDKSECYSFVENGVISFSKHINLKDPQSRQI